MPGIEALLAGLEGGALAGAGARLRQQVLESAPFFKSSEFRGAEGARKAGVLANAAREDNRPEDNPRQ